MGKIKISYHIFGHYNVVIDQVILEGGVIRRGKNWDHVFSVSYTITINETVR